MRLANAFLLHHMQPVRVSTALRCWLLYPSLVLATTVLGWSLSFAIILDLKSDMAVHGLIFMLAFIFYNRDRLTESESPADQFNMGERTRWIATHQRLLRRVVVGAVGVTVALLVVRPAAILPIASGLGFALIYSVPLLPGARTPKQLPGLKAPYVAMLWTLVVIGIPMSVAGRPWDGHALLTAGFMLTAAIALITINDIRDIAGDRAAGTRTLAVILGEYGVRVACIGCTVLAALAGLTLSSPGLVVVAGLIALITLVYRREADSLFRWIIEGIGLLVWLVVSCLR